MKHGFFLCSALTILLFFPACMQINFDQNVKSVPKFGMFQIEYDLDRPLVVTFTSPTGKVYQQGSFRDSDSWKVRFTPTEVGEYSFRFPGSPAFSFQSIETSSKGFIRAVDDDLVYDSGERFFGIGSNVAWADSLSIYNHYFARLSENGANLIRIIMVPWDTGIEIDNLYNYSLIRAKHLDDVLESAREHDLKVILSFDIYGELRTESEDPQEMLWKENPYNSENNGPCDTPACFFTDDIAKAAYKERLNYMVMRYGYDPNILAFEFWNEIDITDDYDLLAVSSWVKEMADFIREQDIYNHLLTISFADPDTDDGMWTEMDIIQIHYHNDDVIEKMPELIASKTDLKKPIIFSEFSKGNTIDKNLDDISGEVLHDGIWIASMHGVSALPWWWDEYIEPYDLYSHFKELSRYWNATDCRDCKPLDVNFECGGCSVYGYGTEGVKHIYVDTSLGTRLTYAQMGNFAYDIYNSWNVSQIISGNASDTIAIETPWDDPVLVVRRNG